MFLVEKPGVVAAPGADHHPPAAGREPRPPSVGPSAVAPAARPISASRRVIRSGSSCPALRLASSSGRLCEDQAGLARPADLDRLARPRSGASRPVRHLHHHAVGAGEAHAHVDRPRRDRTRTRPSPDSRLSNPASRAERQPLRAQRQRRPAPGDAVSRQQQPQPPCGLEARRAPRPARRGRCCGRRSRRRSGRRALVELVLACRPGGRRRRPSPRAGRRR